MLWNIFFADLEAYFVAYVFDIVLGGQMLSHVEQVDDMALFTTLLRGLQRKVDSFMAWSDANFMLVSAPKSKWMVMGPVALGQQPLRLTISGEPVELVEEFKYVGIHFTSTARNIFAVHYHIKALKARNVVNATFAMETIVGCLPPREGVQLYMARVDPLLTFGCEVALDVDEGLLGELEAVQHLYLCRLLGLHSRSTLAILFTETGVMPIKFRCVILAIGYLIYLLSLPPLHFARVAFEDSLALARLGCPCWLSDL
jgi:hypothetical protein